MARRSRTSEKVAGFREVLGDYDALRSFTHISPQRLSAIAQGAKTTASERGRIGAFSRRMQEGHVSYALVDAARRRGLGLNQIGQQLQGVARGDFKPLARVNLMQLANKFGVDLGQVQDKSLKRQRIHGTRDRRDPRGITEAFITDEGRVVAYGADGHKYAAYTVSNRQTGERRFFWGRFDAIAYYSVAEFEGLYLDDGGDYSVDFTDVFD